MKIAALIASLIMMGSFLDARAASAQDESAQDASAQDANAQDASADTDREEEARMSFELGSRHYRRGEFRQAAEAFERSHAYSPHPALLYNAYLGYRDANDDANAARTLRGYLEGVEDTAERRVVLERRLAALEAELGGDAEGGEPAPEEPSSGSPIGAIVLTSVGAAAVVAGVVTAIVTNGIHSDVAAECPNQTCANLAAQQADIDRGRRFGRTTDALLFGGGALLVGGVLWWVLGGSSGDESASQQTNVQAMCVQSGCELGVRGSF